MTAPSVERAVGRALVQSIVMVALAIVGVSAIATTGVVVHRDDKQAQAQALTLGAELHNHRYESPENLRELVQHELIEQSHFARHLEVWHEGRLLSEAPAYLTPWRAAQGCVLATAGGSVCRVCSVQVAPKTTILVAYALAPLLIDQIPILLSIALSAFLAAFAYGIAARRHARRSLEPLKRFDQAVADLPAVVASIRLPMYWHAAEVDQLAMTFNALLDRIDGAVAREQRFVANAAHELRTPVTRLRGQLELAQQEGASTDEARKRLALATRSCLELGRSIEAILALARSEAPTLETVELSDVVEDTLKSFDVGERSRVLTTGQSAIVRGDEILLGLAVRNLIDNSLKYSAATVEICVRHDADGCRITVRDHGSGISGIDFPRVREPFIRGTLRPSSVRGSGLGLALVDHVLTQHGGRLELHNGSSADPGLFATLVLPAWAPSR